LRRDDEFDDGSRVLPRPCGRSGRGGYVNFLTDDRSEEEARSSLAGVDLDRLAAVRRRWDPEGVLGGGAA